MAGARLLDVPSNCLDDLLAIYYQPKLCDPFEALED